MKIRPVAAELLHADRHGKSLVAILRGCLKKLKLYHHFTSDTTFWILIVILWILAICNNSKSTYAKLTVFAVSRKQFTVVLILHVSEVLLQRISKWTHLIILHHVLVKCKVQPNRGYYSPEGEYMHSSTISLTSTLDGGGWLTPRPLYPREWPGTYCIGGWVAPRAGLDWCGNSHLSFGFDPRTEASRYTDWAIPVPFIYRVSEKDYTLFLFFFSRCPVCGEWCKLHW
jgi:hypothetical protein